MAWLKIFCCFLITKNFCALTHGPKNLAAEPGRVAYVVLIPWFVFTAYEIQNQNFQHGTRRSSKYFSILDRWIWIHYGLYLCGGYEDTFLLLKRNPMLGRFHKGDIRSCVFKKRTVVFYTIENTTIYIIRIFDTRQDWSSFF